jgi:toxin ParE1/3/4
VKLTIRPAARRDILHDYQRYLELDLPHIAERFLASVNAAIDAVIAMPKAGSPKILGNRLLAGLRSWPVKGFDDFRVYYLERPDELDVVRIINTKRDVGTILESEQDDSASQ